MEKAKVYFQVRDLDGDDELNSLLVWRLHLDTLFVVLGFRSLALLSRMETVDG